MPYKNVDFALNCSVSTANDIAVWRVNRPFVFNDWVQPAVLAPAGFTAEGKLDFAGWGWLQ